MIINSTSLYKKIFIGVVSVIISATGLSKFTRTATSVEAATASPCIVTISGVQYDVAPLTAAGVHPGGNVFVCGTDMTSLFMSMPTHATDIARMMPYIYVSPTINPSPIPSTTPNPTVTPSPIPSSTPGPIPSTTPAPSISPSPHHEENEVEVENDDENEEDEHVEGQRLDIDAAHHGKEVRVVARNNSDSRHDNDHNHGEEVRVAAHKD